MALDGAFLRHVKQEIESAALGARVDKIYEPNREELVLILRTYRDSLRLLLSARAGSARVCFTDTVPENPKQPPMLCMLLRKRLCGAKLCAVRQPELERVLHLEFDAVNELGDHVRLTLTAEIMGRYSNLILTDETGKIVDALKRVDAEMSSERMVLPGLRYRLPPAQDKLCLLEDGAGAVLERLSALPRDMALSGGLLAVIQGVSPVVCREAEYFTGRGAAVTVRGMTEAQQERLRFYLGRLRDTVLAVSGEPCLAWGPDGKPLDFSFLPIQQYGTSAVVQKAGSFSALLERFYGERDRHERMRVRSGDLLRLLTSTTDRLSRKINHQRAELEQCGQRDYFRVCGDLLTANQYRIEKGAVSVELPNYYEPDQPPLCIKLDPARSALQNAQKYYKDYRRARTAEEKLREQIALAQEELAYLDTVFEELSRAETEADLLDIRQELRESGYLRARKQAGKRAEKPKRSEPLRYRSPDGFAILVGRNNRGNDELTLRRAKKQDLWFHTKNIPGSHVILVTEGRQPTEEAVRAAALYAAANSRAGRSSQVPVDYTQVKNVSKPNGAKPGMVIYVNYNTVYVTPERPEEG